MKKQIGLLVFSLAFIAFSCSEDDYVLTPPEVAIENLSDATEVQQGELISFKANLKSIRESTFKWLLNGVEVCTDSTYVFTADDLGDYTVSLVCTNTDGEQAATVDIHVYGLYRDGTFVLNEGNMTSETGSLIFIDNKGGLTENAYYTANNAKLGNVAQDLFITDGKLYIIAQNGVKSTIDAEYGSEGRLVIAHAETLKREASYDEEVASLSWPTHIAVVGESAFIRDNKGVHLFNTITKELLPVAGTKGALKNRMVVADGKVFVPANKSVFVLEKDKTQAADTIVFDAAVSGVLKASDGNLWVSTTGSPQKIMKVSSRDYTVIQTNEMPADAKLGAGSGVSPGISAKGDTIYFSNASTKIYRHIFSKNETEFMADVKSFVPDAIMAYNNLSVHPITGEVYFTSIKGFGENYRINDISVFNFEDDSPKLVADYKNYTRFPAGVFFTDNFK